MYTRITLDEMIDYLKAEKGWKITEPAGEEAYFDYERKGFIIRVYSSIARSGVCRAKGKDAIRVAILYVDGDDQTRGIKKFPPCDPSGELESPSEVQSQGCFRFHQHYQDV